MMYNVQALYNKRKLQVYVNITLLIYTWELLL